MRRTLMMPEAHRRRFRRRKIFIEHPLWRGLQSHGIVDVQTAVVPRKLDVRQRLYLFRGARGVENFARQQFNLPKVRTQFGVIREANEIDSFCLIFEVVEKFGMPE
jgi:hypothetical protein